MSSAGVKAAKPYITAIPDNTDFLDPGHAPNDIADHLSGHGNIFSENDPNNKKALADGDVGAAADLGIAARVDSQFSVRDQSISRAAQAAGAQRSDNDADLLGFTSTAKRRSASRALLG